MNTNKFLIIIVVMFFIACKNESNKSINELSKIKSSEIEIVEIKKRFSDSNSVKLNKEQIKNVVDLINESSNAKLLKAGPKYWLSIKLKNDSIKKHKITDDYFGENDLYVKIKEKDYFKKIYENNLKTKSLIEINYR